MAIEIKHKFQSAKADSSDASLIRPSNWNDTHKIELGGQRLLGRATTGQGDAQEVSIGSGLEWSSGQIRVKPSDFITTAIIEGALGYSMVKQTGSTALSMEHSSGTTKLKIGSAVASDNWPIHITGKSANSDNLGGQAPSYYTNIPARLGYTPVRQYGSNNMGLFWSGSDPVVRVDTTDFLVVTNANAPHFVRTNIANSGAGVVGSYALLGFVALDKQEIGPGTHVAGSSLRWASASGDRLSATIEGTWRCMGYLPDASVNTKPGNRETLFLRFA